MADITPIQNDFLGKDIISLSQFDSQSILTLFSKVPKMAEIGANAKPSNVLAGNIVTLLFYEPSSRTYGSFAASVKQLGGNTLDILDPANFSSVAKGESLEDTIRVFEAYSDAIVIRHPEKETAKKAAKAALFVPVINAGDGVGEHPTQALLDLYTIYEKHKKIDGLTGVIAGDLKNGRTVHSLLLGLSLFKNNTVYLLSPDSLRLPKDQTEDLKKRGLNIVEITSENKIPKDADFWYWTRVQKERFANENDYNAVKGSFILTSKLLNEYGNDQLIIMHPLPRVGEIETSVDQDQRAVYLTNQTRNGMYVRMTLIALILGKYDS